MSEPTDFEIDFLPVGNGNRSGDAIAIRFGTSGDYKVLVYDGGTKESGQALVDHIVKYYKTTTVDYVVNSHPDADHASGLSVVLEQLNVGELWIHRPWKYSSIISDYFHDGRITDASLGRRLQDKLSAAYNLEKLALQQGVTIKDPFQGAVIGGTFHVLSPEINWYVHDLIPEFEKSPDKKTNEYVGLSALAGGLRGAQNRALGGGLLGEQNRALGGGLRATGGVLGSLLDVAARSGSWIMEQWGMETIREEVSTSAENESSVILYAYIDGKGIMLSGDAGIKALNAVAHYTETNHVSLPQSLTFIQIPHHGSRHNVSPSVLDRIVGPRLSMKPGKTGKIAFVSAGKESTTHPRKVVVNAFVRRGIEVISTEGSPKRHHHNMPPREGWTAAKPLSFSEKVESWD